MFPGHLTTSFLETVLQAPSSLVLASILLFLATCLLIRKTFFHPLRHIPGPFISKMSATPLFYHAVTGNRAFHLMDLHKKYGPVVQIAPNKVCVSSDQGIKPIYGGKMSKSHAYDTFHFGDVKMCIGLLHPKQAQSRRRGLLPAFSQKNLMEMEPTIRFHLDRFLQWLEKFDKSGESVDVFKWFRYLTFDVVTDIAFGQQIGMLTSGDNHFITQIEYRNKRNALNGAFPFILPVLRLFHVKVAEAWMNADNEIAQYAIKARDGWKKTSEEDLHRIDILSRLEKIAEDTPDEGLSEKEIIAEIMEILNAGSDTTANTAMFTSWELARNPDTQRALHKELVEAFPDPTQSLDFNILEPLPYLNGVVREGLRKHAPIPAFLERVVPDEGVEICGLMIPKGTVIGMQAYTNHLDESVYPDPESFIPERWFDPTAEMRLNFLPFSSGPRACLGLNLANMQLRIHLAHIFRKYRVSPAPHTTPESMSHLEFFTIRPKEGKCELFFHKYEK